MSGTKYGKHIIDAPIMQSVVFPKITAPQINASGAEHFMGFEFSMNWSYLTEAFEMVGSPHSHDFDQVVCFIGGDPYNIREFGAELEMYFGEEMEKHIVTSSSHIVIPRGLIHGPLYIRKITKPIMYMDFPLTAQYIKKETD